MSLHRVLWLILGCLILGTKVQAQVDVYGHVKGHRSPQKLNLTQIESIKTKSFGQIDTWLVIIDRLNTSRPRVHLIDTEHFKRFPSEYGVHQAYAQQMGLVSNGNDFMNKLSGKPNARTLMPLTIFNFQNSSIQAPDQRRASWVVQNRRYRFQDSSASLTASLIKSQQSIRAGLPLVDGVPHFITYEAENSFRRPNRKTTEGRADIAALRAAGFSSLSENEMVSAGGATVSMVQVHNAVEKNEAFGYLRVIEEGGDIDSLTPQDIAIFKSLPDRIPPVAAILTLEAQTPLSHINVLAINRGTLNVAVNEAASSEIEEVLRTSQLLKDRPAKLTVVNGAIRIVQTSAQEVASFQQKQKRKIGVVEIPTINTSTGLGVIKPTGAHGPSEIGAKAANYGRIERLLGRELVVPGYAIGFSLYREVVERGGAESIEKRLIEPLLAKVRAGALSPVQVNLELEEIRTAISSTSIPQQTVESLARFVSSTEYKNYEKMRFRSSTNCEDLPRFNGAGLYLSEGIKTKVVASALTDSKSLKKLNDDLLLVLGSLWLPRAFWEREYFSIDHRKAAMAIQINPSFTDEAANGVLVVTKKKGKFHYWLNSQLGEASVTNPEDGQVPESLRFESSAKSVGQLSLDLRKSPPSVLGRSSVGDVFVFDHRNPNPDAAQLLALVLDTGRRILESLVSEPDRFGIDIEFKLVDAGGELKLNVKQARPLNLELAH